MKDNSILNKVRELLGMEVKLAERMLEDGQTKIEAEEFAEGFQVAIVTEDEQKIPMPVGEYKLDGDEGEMLVIKEEGIIAEMKKEAEEEKEVETKEEEKEEVEAATEATSEETKPVKKTVESIVKETFFSEIEALKKENEELKAEVEHLSKINNKEELAKDETTEEVTSEETTEVVEETVELSNEEPAAKPITHNPENEEKIELHQFSKNRAKTTMDRVMEKLSKK